MDIIAQFGADNPAPLKQTSVLYAVGAINQSAKARSNITAQQCGFFASNFHNWEKEQQKTLQLGEQLTPFRVKALSEHFREAAAQAGSNRLVKGRKSRTGGKEAFYRFKSQASRMHQLKKALIAPLVLNPSKYHNAHYSASFAAVSHGKVLNGNRKASIVGDKPLVKVQLQRRDWSQQYRLQQIIETPASDAPEQNSGDRFTEKLTARAVKNIFESAAYTAVKHGGFKTFVTLTFDAERRRRVLDGTALTKDGRHYSPVAFRLNMGDSVTEVGGAYTAFEWYKGKARNPKLMNETGEIAGHYCPLFTKPEKVWEVVGAKTTIGAEVSMFINAVKKMRRRGFMAYVTERDAESGRLFVPVPKIKASVLPDKSDFHYLWVAECPSNEDGEPNPHVHLLMDWDMAPELFAAWAERIEKLWGNGFATIERIKKPQAAGTYIIKAVGYAAKGANADQGIIRGNRYNMAACSRAPKWETLGSFEAGNIAGILSELGHKLDQWKKPMLRAVRRYEQAKEQTVKAAGIAKQQCDGAKLAKLTNRIKRLEQQIKETRAATKAAGLHVSASNRFSITFDRNAEIKINQFMKWAAGARGWSMKPIYADGQAEREMAEIRNAARQQYARDFVAFNEKQAYWEAVKNDPLEPIPISAELYETQRAQAWAMYEKAAIYYQ
ncbi:hypothetical protein RRK67_001254 [Vibrio fluvialis]|nr:hypothetical protein [Vibrio fluvialis]ELF6478660.1 hypothetical protein [Vibrio fluvialis]ELI5718173.1 hypothetical protein [Vibrio fluvialis]